MTLEQYLDEHDFGAMIDCSGCYGGPTCECCELCPSCLTERWQKEQA